MLSGVPSRSQQISEVLRMWHTVLRSTAYNYGAVTTSGVHRDLVGKIHFSSETSSQLKRSTKKMLLLKSFAGNVLATRGNGKIKLTFLS